jgi:ParB family chromosome partitioning protein
VTQEKYFTYRGDMRAVAITGGQVVFVTTHPEGRPTAVYLLDPEKLTLSEQPLPAGGRALLAPAEGLWVAGTDSRLYHLASGKPPAARGAALAAPPIALALLSADRLAAAAGSQVIVLARKDGRSLQTLELSEPVTCLAADPTGHWLAAGTAKGTVTVFECENTPQFQVSDSAALHEAAVTALWFEADELRFLSAGADQKLLSTHARGKLEAEDRGRGANHTDPITAIITGVAGRFLTGSSDATIKAWPRGVATRPVTLKDGVAKVVALGVVQVHGKPQVVAACEDNSLRFFELDEEGKFGDATIRVYGADDWAKYELSQADPQRREAALRTLTDFADAASTRLIAGQMKSDADAALRLRACKLLASLMHPSALKELEEGLKHKDEAVRIAAFEGLVSRADEGDLRPLLLALRTEKVDIGKRAVTALEERATKDPEARARLTEAMERKTPEVRQAALASLERVHGADSPEPNLTALRSEYADLRRLALLRLYQRKLVHDLRVQGALRWRGEDQDPEVRRLAFLLSLYTRERLLNAMRERDAELNRQLTELESGAVKVVAEDTSASAPGEETHGQSPPAAVPVAAAAPAPGPPDLTTIMSRLDSLAQAGLINPVAMEHTRKMIAGLQGASKTAMLNQIAAQIEALSRQARPPSPSPTPPTAEVADLDKLVQAGMLPPQMVERVRQMLAGMQGPAREAILRQIAAQLQMLTQRGLRPGQPQAPAPPDDLEEDESDEDME